MRQKPVFAAAHIVLSYLAVRPTAALDFLAKSIAVANFALAVR